MALRRLMSDLATAAEYAKVRLQLGDRYRREPLDLLLADLGRGPSMGRVDAAKAVPSERVLRGLDEVLARVPGVPNTCLYRSIARYAVYTRRGAPVRFVMGLRKASGAYAGDGVEGHAWIELGAIAVNESDITRFIRTFEYPPPSKGP